MDRDQIEKAYDALNEAADLIDAAARAMTLAAASADVVMIDAVRAAMHHPNGLAGFDTLEELTKIAQEFGKTGAQVHGWANGLRAGLKEPVTA